MGIAQTELQVTWNTGNNSFDLATGNSWTQESDAMDVADTTIKALIQMKADQTTGTPASGDYVDMFLLATLGDPDGASSDEYDTADHAIHLARLDVNLDDPAIATVDLPMPLLGFKIRAVGAGFASTDVCAVSATVLQMTLS